MTSQPDQVLLAHHAMIIAVPFFVPAVIVSGVVGLVVWRDRHSPEDDETGADTADSGDDRAGS